MTHMHGVIDAFIDDELVSVEELRRALADPAGREYLTDALALRSLVRAEPAAVIERRPAGARARDLSARSWLAFAALLTIVASLVGYTAGTRMASGPSVMAPTANMAPPAPTTVIRLQPGVDWTERVGGN